MSRAAQVVLVLASSTGGVGRHVASLARGLVDAGRTVTVCGPRATQDRFAFTSAGARFVPVEIPASPGPTDLVAVRALRAELTSSRAELVHAHGLRAGLVASLARPSACRLVVTWHNMVLASGLRASVYRKLERRVARTADVALGASADLVARAGQFGAVDARIGAVAAPPLAPAQRTRHAVRAELDIDGTRPLILSVGRLHPQKGYRLLVQAATRWRDRDPRPSVVIAGSGPADAELAEQIAASGAPVTLLGHRTDIADLLAAADIAVVTSVWEARQLFAQEALRSGLPLVATAVGGIPDLVGQAAILVPPGDLDALDAAVGELLDDPAKRAKYARMGPAMAATWPTEADMVASVDAIYTELTGNPGADPVPGTDAA